jgi:hypothetical protein
MERPETKSCTLQNAVGRYEQCPEEQCPLWHDGACTIAAVRADVETTPNLAVYLLDLRRRLAGTDGWAPFRLLPRRDHPGSAEPPHRWTP